MKLLIEYQYFGNVNLYKSLYKHKYIIFELCENYQKSGFRNKMVLAAPTGPLVLSVPVSGGRAVKATTAQVLIDNRQHWQKNHIKTIINLYNRSPWFEFYREELIELYDQRFEKLIDWDLTCFKWICSKLKIDAIVAETENFNLITDPNEILDLRSITISETNEKDVIMPAYNQVFAGKNGFLANICILDLLFCEGPAAGDYLRN